MSKKEYVQFNDINYKRTSQYVIFKNKDFSNLVYKISKLRFQNKELKEDNILYSKFLVGAGIIILILIICMLSFSYEAGVQKCINAGNNENFCREGLK